MIEDNSLDIEIIELAVSEVNSDLSSEIKMTYIKTLHEFDEHLDKNQSLLKKQDIILSDMNIPGTNGVELMKSFKKFEQLVNIPFIFFTSSLFEKEVEDAYLHGASDYILKPESFEDNCKVIKKLHEVYGS